MARHRGSPSGRRPSREERALWDTVTADVTPLGDDHQPIADDEGDETLSTSPKALASAQKPAPRPTAPTASYMPTQVSAGGREPELRHGVAPGLDNRTRQRMRRGQVDIEARIDLHGLTRDQAHVRLKAFLSAAHLDGRRAVLVITGKGGGRDGETGVLRREVPRWLNDTPFRAWVKAFSYAAPKDGGEGALYVLVRRKR